MSAERFRLFDHRMGQDVRAWPMLALLLLVVLVAIGCVLWFMREAVQNARLAVRQSLAEAYLGQLTLMQKRVEEQWKHELERFDRDEPGPALFARAISEGWADAVVCFDAAGSVVYPRVNAEERIAEANAELLALEKLSNRTDPRFAELTNRLRSKVTNYESSTMPSAQRRFLMHQLQRLEPGMEFPTLDAEDLAARYLDVHPSPPLPMTFQATDLPELWVCASPGRHVLALFSKATLRAKLGVLVSEPELSAGVRVTVVPPGEDALMDNALVTSSLASLLPGWRLALALDNRAFFDTAADRKITAYLWTGSAVIAAMTVLGLCIARGLGRQVQLARLKNDLVATVSHELKTPLTAMRALVDTLLDAEKFDETTTREYIQLLARENARLSRLIDNFLTFSRLERNKFNFKFEPIRPQQIADDAIAAIGERRHRPACHFESHIQPDLPLLIADHDALTTALINLLDNAWKYTGDEKRITLRTEAQNGSVRFVVEDNGIGIPKRESHRIFQRFYQVDRRLTRNAEGCGLGLSIVQSIVAAHHGSITVASEIGKGSTFTIEIPVVSQ
jgi:signal transduction histidine kinase